MNVLALSPTVGSLRYEFFSATRRSALLEGEVDDVESLQLPLEALRNELEARPGSPRPDLIAIRAPYGGMRFRAPVAVDPEVLAGLRELVPAAPLHLPRLIAVVEACVQDYESLPVVVVFDTAFFTGLPARETAYGIDPALAETLMLRRFGYHGIFHHQAAAVTWTTGDGASGGGARILSLCLEPQPEVAAILDGRPLMVTGGTTPLEGLPGETACGEIDPSIVLALAENLAWGTEQIDLLLSRQSGLRGLAGRPVTVEEVLSSTGDRLRLAREVLGYRILLAAGAARAVMGGVDGIVVTGRYARASGALVAWLRERLSRGGAVLPLRQRILAGSLLRFVADEATATIRTAAIRSAARDGRQRKGYHAAPHRAALGRP